MKVLLPIVATALFLTGSVEAIWRPDQYQSWNIILGSKIDIGKEKAEIVEIDLEHAKDYTSDYHNRGKKVICYFSGGTVEDYRDYFKEYKSHSGLVRDRYPEWPEEYFIDYRREEYKPLITERIKEAIKYGCDAIDVDNVDLYQLSAVKKWSDKITKEDAIKFTSWLGQKAHSLGISVGLKNCLDIIDTVGKYYDFAINEGCIKRNECYWYKNFLATGKPVFGITYHGLSNNREALCKNLDGLPITMIIKEDSQLDQEYTAFDGKKHCGSSFSTGRVPLSDNNKATTTVKKSSTTTTTRKTSSTKTTTRKTSSTTTTTTRKTSTKTTTRKTSSVKTTTTRTSSVRTTTTRTSSVKKTTSKTSSVKTTSRKSSTARGTTHKKIIVKPVTHVHKQNTYDKSVTSVKPVTHKTESKKKIPHVKSIDFYKKGSKKYGDIFKSFAKYFSKSKKRISYIKTKLPGYSKPIQFKFKYVTRTESEESLEPVQNTDVFTQNVSDQILSSQVIQTSTNEEPVSTIYVEITPSADENLAPADETNPTPTPTLSIPNNNNSVISDPAPTSLDEASTSSDPAPTSLDDVSTSSDPAPSDNSSVSSSNSSDSNPVDGNFDSSDQASTDNTSDSSNTTSTDPVQADNISNSLDSDSNNLTVDSVKPIIIDKDIANEEEGRKTSPIIAGVAVTGSIIGAAAFFAFLKKNPKKVKSIKRRLTRRATSEKRSDSSFSRRLNTGDRTDI